MEEFHHNHTEDILTHRERPQTEAQLQALLIEDYYLSQHPYVTPEQFSKDNALQLEAAKLWRSDSMAAAFRKSVDELKSQGKHDSILDLGLDQIKAHLQ